MSVDKLSVARVHNYYRNPGGEDQTMMAEIALLRQHGHGVAVFTRHNSNFSATGLLARVSLATNAVWNSSVERSLARFFRQHSIEIAHFHNTMPLISPAAYYGAAKAGVAIVQTMHNYRMFCPGATLYRDGSVCEECLGRRFAAPAVRHSCYRGDPLATMTQAVTNAVHHTIGTYRSVIDAYICMTEFSRQKVIAGGIPADRVYVKPHFVHPAPDPGKGDGGYALYIGRLVPEKGWRTLVRAWGLARPSLKLRILGDGPERQEVLQACAENSDIEWCGQLAYADTLTALQGAAFLVFPSEWYETFGRVIIESFACGTPVIATAIGGHSDMVTDNYDGLLFRPGDADDLAAKIARFESDARMIAEMRQNARRSFETHYSAEPNYARLIEIYDAARIRMKSKSSRVQQTECRV